MVGKDKRFRLERAIYYPLLSLLVLALGVYLFALYALTFVSFADFKTGASLSYDNIFLGTTGIICTFFPVICSVSLIVVIPHIPAVEQRVLVGIIALGLVLIVVHGLFALWGPPGVDADGREIGALPDFFHTPPTTTCPPDILCAEIAHG